MIEEGFYFLEPGSIGQVSYYYMVKREFTDEKKEDYHTKTASAYVHNLIWKSVHNPENVPDPSKIFQTARDFSNDQIKQSEYSREIMLATIQIGSKESYEFITKLEKDKDFKGWFEPEFIELIKKDYETSISK